MKVFEDESEIIYNILCLLIKELYMKFICQRDTILKEIEHANNFTSQRNALSISSNVLIENYQNLLTIKSTDTKLGFSTSFPVVTEVPGATTVICEKFLSILKSLPSCDLIFTDEDDRINITVAGNDSIRFNLKTLAADRFPELISCSDPYFSISQKDFFDMIHKTSFSVGTDETKFFLTGVYMEKNDEGQLVLASTDGKRLSCSRKVFEQEIPDFKPCIIPIKFLNQLMSIGSGEGLFSLAVTNAYIFAEINGHSIYSTLITGNYPAYKKVIPQSFAYECRINVKSLLDALNQVSLCVDSNSKKIFLDFSRNGVLLSSENTEIGDAKIMINCDYDGPDTTISFNYSFLQTPLKIIETESVKICFNSANTAIAVLPEPERDYIFVIMPMH